jgi:hypothetical protein
MVARNLAAELSRSLKAPSIDDLEPRAIAEEIATLAIDSGMRTLSPTVYTFNGAPRRNRDTV